MTTSLLFLWVRRGRRPRLFAADIVVKGVTPAKVAAYANTLLQESGGIGEYRNFVHIDVRHEKSRWRGI